MLYAAFFTQEETPLLWLTRWFKEKERAQKRRIHDWASLFSILLLWWRTFHFFSSFSLWTLFRFYATHIDAHNYEVKEVCFGFLSFSCVFIFKPMMENGNKKSVHCWKGHYLQSFFFSSTPSYTFSNDLKNKQMKWNWKCKRRFQSFISLVMMRGLDSSIIMSSTGMQ